MSGDRLKETVMCSYFSAGRVRPLICVSFIITMLLLTSCGERELVLTEDYSLRSTVSMQPEWEVKGILVDISGEVMKPGVYSLKTGCRVYEAINLAGGLTEYACTEHLNLVDVLSDGARLVVPSYDTVMESDPRININKADITALSTLPGIGRGRSQAIIEYRERKGGFTSCEQIMEVSGIGETIYDRIKDLICVQ